MWFLGGGVRPYCGMRPYCDVRQWSCERPTCYGNNVVFARLEVSKHSCVVTGYNMFGYNVCDCVTKQSALEKLTRTVVTSTYIFYILLPTLPTNLCQ